MEKKNIKISYIDRWTEPQEPKNVVQKVWNTHNIAKSMDIKIKTGFYNIYSPGKNKCKAEGNWDKGEIKCGKNACVESVGNRKIKRQELFNINRPDSDISWNKYYKKEIELQKKEQEDAEKAAKENLGPDQFKNKKIKCGYIGIRSNEKPCIYYQEGYNLKSGKKPNIYIIEDRITYCRPKLKRSKKEKQLCLVSKQLYHKLKENIKKNNYEASKKDLISKDENKQGEKIDLLVRNSENNDSSYIWLHSKNTELVSGPTLFSLLLNIEEIGLQQLKKMINIGIDEKLFMKHVQKVNKVIESWKEEMDMSYEILKKKNIIIKDKHPGNVILNITKITNLKKQENLCLYLNGALKVKGKLVTPKMIKKKYQVKDKESILMVIDYGAEESSIKSNNTSVKSNSFDEMFSQFKENGSSEDSWLDDDSGSSGTSNTISNSRTSNTSSNSRSSNSNSSNNRSNSRSSNSNSSNSNSITSRSSNSTSSKKSNKSKLIQKQNKSAREKLKKKKTVRKIGKMRKKTIKRKKY